MTTMLNYELYYKQYVPSSGNANTVGGELIRAINHLFVMYEDEAERIGCSDFAEAYVNPAARYIYHHVEDEAIRTALNKCWGKDAFSKLIPYVQRLNKLFHDLWVWISAHAEVFQQSNTVCFEDELECELDEKNAVGYDFSRDYGVSLNKAGGKTNKRRK